MNDSNCARSRTLFLLPFSDVRRFATVRFVAMALTLSACGSDTAQESLIEALADVEGLDVEIDDDTLVYSVEGDDGFSAVVGSGASVPSGFPDDVLVYEDAEIVTLSMETEEGFQLMLLAQATPEEVLRAYQTSLVGAGWRQNLPTRWSQGFSNSDLQERVRGLSLSRYPAWVTATLHIDHALNRHRIIPRQGTYERIAKPNPLRAPHG